MATLRSVSLSSALLLALALTAAGCGDDSVISEPLADASSDTGGFADLGTADTAKSDATDAGDAAAADSPDSTAPEADAAAEIDAAADSDTGADTAEVTPPNQAPTLSFVAPAQDATVQAGEAVAFELQAQDDGGAAKLLVTAHYKGASAALWSGNPGADGKIGFALPSLTPGPVQVVVLVTDEGGLTASAERALFVNTAPGAPGVTIAPAAPTTLDALVAKVSEAASDPDRKPEELQYSYKWFKDGQLTSELTPTVVAGVAKKGEVWKVEVIAADPTAKGPAGQAQVVIGDAAASTPTVVLDPPAVDLQSEVSCAASGAVDADGEAVSYSYQWFVNGLAFSGATGQTWKLASAPLKVGDLVACKATASSGGVSGGSAMSASASVQGFDVCNSPLNPCSAQAKCTGSDTLIPTCACLDGYSGNGNVCDDVDECAADNGGCGTAAFWSCKNNAGAAPTCTDIDECAKDNGGCGDAKFWSCKNNPGAAPTCGDIDECAQDNGGCGDAKFWSCKNNPGNAPSCGDIDECAQDNGGCGDAKFWSCKNNSGSAPTCSDIDECAADNGGCGSAEFTTCSNNPGAAPTCTDIDECKVDNGGCGDPALYSCSNNQGGKPTCSDIDECKLDNGGCGDAAFFKCINKVGAKPQCDTIALCGIANGGCGDPKFFLCSEQIGGLPVCSDIDECQVNNGGCGNPQHVKCTNQVGAAAQCSDIDECKSDNGGCGDAKFYLCANNQGAPPSCSDIDECAQDNGGCGDAKYFSCKNNPGAAPTCADIDECKANNGGCGAASYIVCTNNVGKAPTCTDIDECKTNNGGCGDAKYWLCSNQQAQAPKCSDIDECQVNNGGCGDPKAFTCKNNAGGAPTCSDIDECASNNGGCGAGNICTNKAGGFQCSYPNCIAVRDAKLASGVYSVYLGAPRDVYCDSTTAGGGWMFIKPADIQALSGYNFNTWRSDKGQVLIRLSGSYGQAYTVIKQLPAFAAHPLSVAVAATAGASTSAGYNLKLTMIPVAVAAAQTVQGFNSNGKDLTFVNCDANPNSYFEFFAPNGGYDFAGAYPLTNAWLASKLPGGSLGAGYLSKAAMHDGGCGAHSTSSYWATIDGTSAAALGIR